MFVYFLATIDCHTMTNAIQSPRSISLPPICQKEGVQSGVVIQIKKDQLKNATCCVGTHVERSA